MKNIDKEVQEMFSGLSREELIDLLESVGFDVEDGEGKVIYTDDVDGYPQTSEIKVTINASVQFKNNYYNVSTNYNNFDMQFQEAC